MTGLLRFLEPRAFSARDVANGKPAPDLFLLAAKTLRINPADCIVVEGSVAGITAASAAGIRPVGFVARDQVAARWRTTCAQPAPAPSLPICAR